MSVPVNTNFNTPFLKMLLVDDEPLMRQGFKVFFDWKKYFISQVFDAENSIEAIHMAETEKPDIVITDIRMPEIDGLELIASLKNILPKAIFIVISGYDDFDYAKQSISLGVFHYLVKPVHSAELHEVMSKCIDKIQMQIRREAEEAELNNKLKEALPVLRNSFIQNIFKEGIYENEEDCLSSLEQLELDIAGDFYKAIVISHLNLKDTDSKTRSKMNIIIKEAFDHYFKTIINVNNNVNNNDNSKVNNNDNNNDIKHYIMMDMDTLKGIISWNGNININSVICSLVENIVQVIEPQYEIRLICSSGSHVKRITDIHISAGEASDIIENKYKRKQPGLWLFEEVKGFGTARPFFLSRTDQKKLITCVENNDIDTIRQVIYELNSIIKDLDYISMEYIYSSILEMIISVTRYTYECGFNDNYSEPKIFAYDYFKNFKSLDEIFIWMESYLTGLTTRFNNFRVRRPRKIIEEITSYIAENTHLEISLNKIAEKFYYNPSYLSRLFKEEMNTNFLEYVNKIKIQKAMELLKNSDLTALSICDKVGYRDYKYFTSVFRKHAGMNPHEFKKKG